LLASAISAWISRWQRRLPSTRTVTGKPTGHRQRARAIYGGTRRRACARRQALFAGNHMANRYMPKRRAVVGLWGKRASRASLIPARVVRDRNLVGASTMRSCWAFACPACGARRASAGSGRRTIRPASSMRVAVLADPGAVPAHRLVGGRLPSRRRTDRLEAAGPDDRAAGNPGITPHDRDAGAPARRGLRDNPVQRASPPPGM